MGQVAIARAAVYISFEPSQRFVDQIVGWLTDFCHLTLEDLDVVSRLQLAVHELVENIVKYGSQSPVGVEVELQRTQTASILQLKTKNTATPERLQQAVRLLTDLRDAPDPIAYYDKLVRESAPVEGVSGLGLARIRAEGDLDIDFAVTGDELCVTVQATI